jgi:hypothetical protein
MITETLRTMIVYSTLLFCSHPTLFFFFGNILNIEFRLQAIPDQLAQEAQTAREVQMRNNRDNRQMEEIMTARVSREATNDDGSVAHYRLYDLARYVLHAGYFSFFFFFFFVKQTY